MNDTLKQAIGVGAGFPIYLSHNDQGQTLWKPLEGDINLINQNIASILNYSLGQRLRQEDFGSRLWEVIEEPNHQSRDFLIRRFIKDSLEEFEERIRLTDVVLTRQNSFLHIEIKFTIKKTNIASSVTTNLDTETPDHYLYLISENYHEIAHHGEDIVEIGLVSSGHWRVF